MSSADRRLARIAEVRDNIRRLAAELHLSVEDAQTLDDVEDLLDRHEEELSTPIPSLDAQTFELINAEDLESGDRFVESETGVAAIDRPSKRLLERIASISVPVDRPEKVLLETTSGRARYVLGTRWVWRRLEDA